MQKGGRIEAEQIALLQSLGCETDYVARSELDDVDENGAALSISHKVAGDGIRLSRAVTGRVSFWHNQPSLKIIVRVPEEVKFSHYLKSNFLG